jgi:alpha-1,3/alpha-1,6-mannosyltransferase
MVVPDNVEVLFLQSVPSSLKETLLNSASLLVYTPSNEHFGIVPLEAMLAGLPVLAANNGGPTETVVEDVTGWLRDPSDKEPWTEVMDRVLNKLPKDKLEAMGKAGISRVMNNFADKQMAERLDSLFKEIENVPRHSSMGGVIVLGVLGLATGLGLWALASAYKLVTR